MMTVKECYESMEADFEGVIGRMGIEEMVKRFALKFLDDPSYSNLEKAIQEQNAEENSMDTRHYMGMYKRSIKIP